MGVHSRFRGLNQRRRRIGIGKTLGQVDRAEIHATLVISRMTDSMRRAVRWEVAGMG